MSEKEKIFWMDKEEKFIWKFCPTCKLLTVEPKDKSYIPNKDDLKYIKELTKALVFPKKFHKFLKQCKPDKWLRHIVTKE